MVFIVGEIGVNWKGDFAIAKQMIQQCKEIGCDAIKFQSFNFDVVKEHPEKEILLNSSISKDNIDEIDSMAKTIGIEWFSTPMFPEAVDFLEPYVQRYKIREKDGQMLLNNKTSPLFDKIIKTHKEMFVSCYSSPKNSIFYDNPKIKWLYCVPKYPCSLSDLDFKNLQDFHGYSNHCPKIMAPITAAVLGAKVIEIHVTPDKNSDFIDNPVSFDYEELSLIIKHIREIETIEK